jgi:hypothetical protein
MNYNTLFLDPIKEMMHKFLGFLPTLFTALVILVVGWIAAKLIRKYLTQLLHMVGFDSISDTVGLSRFLKVGGIKRKPSDLVGCITYWVFMVMVLITTVKSFGLTVVGDLTDTVIGYIPSVFTGVLILIVGMLIARLVSALVYVTAKNTDMPSPLTLSRLTKIAIMAYVGIIFLKEIGLISVFTDASYTTITYGIVFALSLAFGLAGKDIAAKYLDVFNVKKTHPVHHK